MYILPLQIVDSIFFFLFTQIQLDIFEKRMNDIEGKKNESYMRMRNISTFSIGVYNKSKMLTPQTQLLMRYEHVDVL